MTPEELGLEKEPPLAEVVQSPTHRFHLDLVGEGVDRFQEALPEIAGDLHELLRP